jgi:hypothetical protein
MFCFLEFSEGVSVGDAVTDGSGCLQFADGVTWRVSQRGLVACGPGGAPLLIEHARAGALPALLDEAHDAAALAAALGGSVADRQLVDDLIAESILADPAVDGGAREQPPVRRVVFTRSGVEFTGMEALARMVHRIALPVVSSWLGRIVVAVIVCGGIASLISGRPDGPQVSAHPWIDATMGLVLGLGASMLHEIAHGVTLVHYGRSPRRAGCGFYWGALCFYVDCSDGITLPRRARITNALAGLAVDVVTTSLLLIVAHFASPVLMMAVCWRIAILALVAIVVNGLPILEVDGHVAFTDYLDEPDLSPRSREALSRRLRGVKQPETPSWLPYYGAFSLIGGVVLIASSVAVWWLAAQGLIKALLGGNTAEFLLGLYIIVPFALATLFSTVGLAIELVSSTSDRPSPQLEPN